jgi:hypothetical protein
MDYRCFATLYSEKSQGSKATKDREKISTDFESCKFFDVRLTKFKNSPILLHKISHRFLLATKPFTGLKDRHKRHS